MTAPARIIARWPEMMLERDAADYCSLSLAAFQREVYAGRLPGPVRFGGKDHWRKSIIDRALDVLTGDAPTQAEDAPWLREIKERHARKNAQA